jgi:lipoate-protein ligase A
MEDLSFDPEHGTWRLVNTGFMDGVSNMAVDEAIIKAVSEKRSLPTLRFYGWKPPCVSVGYNQSLVEVDLDRCREEGYTWVRRPTGGKAVLHIDELTYSVVAPEDEERVVGDILTSYRRLSLGLVAGLRSLGCDVRQEGVILEKKTIEKPSACFVSPSSYEVTAMDRKLIGSAQMRRGGMVLQHGSLPLTGDVTRLADVLVLSGADRKTLKEKLNMRAIVLDEALGRKVDFIEAAAAIVKGFEEALNLNLKPGELSKYELDNLEQLSLRYSSGEWTFKR